MKLALLGTFGNTHTWWKVVVATDSPQWYRMRWHVERCELCRMPRIF